MQKIKNLLLGKKYWKRDLVIVAVCFFVGTSWARAGNLESPGTLVPVMYTLNDIYSRLTSNQTVSEGDHSLAPSASPSSSFHTLKEIYEAIPTIEADKVKAGNAYLGISGTLLPAGGDANAGNVCLAKSFFGANQTDWNLQTGTLSIDASKFLSSASYCGITGEISEIGQQIITPTTINQAIDEGFHDGTGYVLGDADLLSENIRSGTTLFGITGNSNVVNTSSGNALASDVNVGKTAWVDGMEISGTGSLLAFGDDDASNVLTTADVAGDFDVSDLSNSVIKKGTTWGNDASEIGTFSGYLGTGWLPNESGSGSTELNQENCENASNWEWFEDANGDGDETDPEDGECVRTATVASDSWNGAEQMTPNNLGTNASPITASSGTTSSLTVSGASWTVDAYKNHLVKLKGGTAVGCWGRVKSNTSDTITVYGTWLTTAYASNCGTPDATSTFIVSDDWGQYDNSWIGDYSCTGDFPDGTVTHGSLPASGTMALAVADCYDGKRDLLPNENDRAVLFGTATSANATSLSDDAQIFDVNVWVGQKVLITSGTGEGSYGFIESNTATQIVVTDWLGGSDPGVGSDFEIIYLVPHASYTADAMLDGDTDDSKANNGPLTAEVLKNWQGTRLPTANDFFGFCGYRNGGSDYETTTGANSSNKTYGNYGGQVGRTDEFLDLANSGSWEWLSEQHGTLYARLAGSNACSYFSTYSVYSSFRFRAVFRP